MQDQREEGDTLQDALTTFTIIIIGSITITIILPFIITDLTLNKAITPCKLFMAWKLKKNYKTKKGWKFKRIGIDVAKNVSENYNLHWISQRYWKIFIDVESTENNETHCEFIKFDAKTGEIIYMGHLKKYIIPVTTQQ